MATGDNLADVHTVPEGSTYELPRGRMVGKLIEEVHVADKRVRQLGGSLGGLLRNYWGKIQTVTTAKIDFVQDSLEGLNTYDETIKRVTNHIQIHGVHKFEELLNTELNRFQTHKINIAVTGKTGAGKSSLINTILNLPADDKQAAVVGTVETESRLMPYAHPDMHSVVLWELTGCDNLCVKRDSYLEETQFGKFDALMLCFCQRFTQDEIWLLTAAQQAAIPVYIVRTKIDQDMANDKLCRPGTHDGEMLLTEMRGNVTKCLAKEGLTSRPIFLISNWLHHQVSWDYAELSQELIMNTPVKNSRALMLALATSSKEAIRAKKEEQLERIPELVQRLATSKDPTTLVKAEISLSAKQFGLTGNGNEMYEVDTDMLNEIVKGLKSSSGLFPLRVARIILSPVQFIQSSVSSKIETYEATLEEAKGKLRVILREAAERNEDVAMDLIDRIFDCHI